MTKAEQSATQKIVQGIMRRAARKANVKPGVHILRHTFCSHLAMRGPLTLLHRGCDNYRDREVLSVKHLGGGGGGSRIVRVFVLLTFTSDRSRSKPLK
jgi:hypothetical protein